MDADYAQFMDSPPAEGMARIFLATNPPHHPQGDYAIRDG